MAEQLSAKPGAAPPKGLGKGRFQSLTEPASGEFDALADLFLGPDGFEEAPMRSRASGEGAPAPIEALVLGHLPVLAPAWVKQYASFRASELGGPVALIRIAGSQVLIEWVGLSTTVTPASSLQEAVDMASAHARAWVLRVDEPLEPVLAGDSAGAVAALTLLSGTDEAAIVACYRALKGLASDDSDGGPELGVVWMGSDQDKADQAMDKVRRACAAFLSRPVRNAGCVERIDTTASTVLYKGSAPSLTDLLHALQNARPPRHEPPAPGQGILRLATPQPIEDLDAADACDPQAASPVQGDRVGVSAERPVPAPAAKPPHPQSLSGHLPGLSTLPITCPDAPKVELAFDAAGRLAVLARALGEAPVPQALADLASAQAWAAKNAQLLRLALPTVKNVDAAAHLLTDRPREARRLLDGPVQVHALLAVQIEGKTAWACAPIN